MPEENKANEITITRFYDAPVGIVWDAWTDPEKTAKWWGPRGFTLTTHSKDLRPGGSWHYTMHGPDGTDYENKTKYYEVVPEAKLVYDHGGNDDRKPLFRVTVLFSSVQGGTNMEMTMTLPSPEAARETRKFIKSAGGDATWDRLAEYLDNTQRGKETFVINRSFSAPIETLFEVWTQPEHVAVWSAPAGFEMKFIKSDIREGGSSFYQLTGDQGIRIYGRAEYVQLKRPSLMIYRQQFCDENENIIRHPAAPTWPESMSTIVRFTSEGAGKTRVTIQWEPHGSVTKEEVETFTAARGGMAQGWTASLDKMEAYLAERI